MIGSDVFFGATRKTLIPVPPPYFCELFSSKFAISVLGAGTPSLGLCACFIWIIVMPFPASLSCLADIVVVPASPPPTGLMHIPSSVFPMIIRIVFVPIANAFKLAFNIFLTILAVVPSLAFNAPAILVPRTCSANFTGINVGHISYKSERPANLAVSLSRRYAISRALVQKYINGLTYRLDRVYYTIGAAQWHRIQSASTVIKAAKQTR